MARELTEIEIKVVDGATKALNSIAKSAAAGKTTFTELSSAVGLVENALGKIAGAASFAVDLLNPAREAETAMQRVAVATNATAAELELLRAKSNQVAFDLRVPFDQVAAGAEQLARDGANATEVLANLETVTAFAGATALKTKDAAAQLSDILDGYGEGIANIGAIGDGIVAAARAAGVGAAELAEGVKKLGPTARDAGVDVGTITAALGVLAENGRGGGRAVKELETILIALKDPASKTGEVLKTLGLDSGNLSGVLTRLSTDSSAAEEVLSTLGPKAALSLKLLLSEGGGALTELNGIIQNSGGASKDAADQLGATFDGAVVRIGIALDALKASFFNPLLKPLADEIDAVSAKILAFSGTKDFETLKGLVLDFTTTTIAQLNKIGADFDAKTALDGIKQFVLDVRIQFAGLAEAASKTKTVLDGFGVALNGAQSIGAEIKGTFGELGVLLGKLDQKIQGVTDSNTSFIKTFDGIAQSARNAAQIQELEFAASLESLKGIVGPATLELKKLQEAQFAQADAARTSAAATDQAKVANDQAAAASPAAAEGALNVAKTLTAGAEAAGKFGERVVTAVGSATPAIEALNKKLAGLQADLARAFKAGLPTQEIVDDIRKTTDELNGLTVAAKPAGAAVKDVGDKASEAAPQLATLGNTASDTSSALDSIKESSAATAAGVGKLAGAVADASQRFVTGSVDLLAFAREANKAGLYFEGLTATIDAYAKARSRAADIALKALQAQVAALDPVQKRLDELRKQFPEATKDVLAQIQQLEQARDRLNGVGPGAPQGAGAGEGGATRSGIGNGVTVNLALSALDPKSLSPDTLKDFARQLSAPLRTLIASGS